MFCLVLRAQNHSASFLAQNKLTKQQPGSGKAWQYKWYTTLPASINHDTYNKHLQRGPSGKQMRDDAEQTAKRASSVQNSMPHSKGWGLATPWPTMRKTAPHARVQSYLRLSAPTRCLAQRHGTPCGHKPPVREECCELRMGLLTRYRSRGRLSCPPTVPLRAIQQSIPARRCRRWRHSTEGRGQRAAGKSMTPAKYDVSVRELGRVRCHQSASFATVIYSERAPDGPGQV